MSNTTIAGKPSNTIGEKDSQLVLRGSSVKIQWGNKFIDLIKNGKINAEQEKIFNVANSQEEITKDGIYIIGEEVWLSLQGTKKLIVQGSANNYISLEEQPDITKEQKIQALTNLGLYYKNKEAIENSGFTSGIFFNQEDNKLYTIIDNKVEEYPRVEDQSGSTDQPSTSTLTEQQSTPVEQQSTLIEQQSAPVEQTSYSLEPNSSELPVGSIILFNNNVEIPLGWAICDGENDTPKLINPFVNELEDQHVVFIMKIS